MHELGLMDAVIRTVGRIIKDENITHVRKIVLEVGELSGTVPHFITDCYEAVVAGTQYQDTELVLEIVPGIARCNDCHIEFRIDIEELCCPVCYGKNLTPIEGKDLIIKEIEAC
jgi:hydrogenase nickel incorporation protein HypA/HybF